MKTILFLICSCLANAANVNLEWDVTPNAKVYHIREKIPNSVDTKFLKESFTNKVTVDVQDGAVLMLTAGNEHGYSPFSEPLTIKFDVVDPIKTLPTMAFKIEYGDDLTGWETKMFFVQDKARLFARVKVTPVQVYLTPENP